MNCDTMESLKAAEAEARERCYATEDFYLQMLHGQTCIEAQRLQGQHCDACETCQNIMECVHREQAA